MWHTVAIQEKRLKMISFRVSGDEIEKLDTLVARVQQYFPFLNKSDILREMIGLNNSGIGGTLRQWLQGDTSRPIRFRPAGDIAPEPSDDPYDGATFDAETYPDFDSFDLNELWER